MKQIQKTQTLRAPFSFMWLFIIVYDVNGPNFYTNAR